MVFTSIHSKYSIQVLIKSLSIGVGANTVIGKLRRKPLRMPRKRRSAYSKNVQRKLFHKLIMAVYEWFDWCCCCMSCAQAKAALGSQSECYESYDGHQHVDEPCSQLLGLPKLNLVIYRHNIYRKFCSKNWRTKKHGNNMKTPFLSSF